MVERVCVFVYVCMWYGEGRKEERKVQVVTSCFGSFLC